jgi:CheY-like chemotaxis protein
MNDQDFLDEIEMEIEHISYLFEDIISNATLYDNKEEALKLVEQYSTIGQMLTDNFMDGIKGSAFVREFKFNNTMRVKVLHDNKRLF